MAKRYHKTVLENGVRVVTGPMTGVKSASLILYFDVGSRYEDPRIGGVSHFLEHMLFKGTKQRPDPMTISEQVEGVGGILNASTGQESTNYWVKVPSDAYADSFELLADMVRNSLVKDEELQKERGVIVEEIRGIEDSPEEVVHEEIDRVIWGDIDLGRSIAGTEETVGNIDRKSMVDFWKRNYRPERLVIASAGEVEHARAVDLAERYFGDMKPKGKPDTITQAITDQAEPRTSVVKRKTEQAHLCIGMPALSYATDRRYVQQMIEAILSSGMSSRLFQEIREKRALVYSVYGYFRSYEDAGQGVIYAGCDVNRADEAVTAILEELRKLRDEPVPADELQRVKTLRKGRMLMAFEDSRSVASWIGGQELMYGEIKTPEQVVSRIEQVTQEQIQELSQELFRTDKLNLAIVGPYRSSRTFERLLEMPEGAPA